MRFLGLMVIAVLAAFAGGAGIATAAPSTTPTTPTTPATPGATLPGGISIPQTGIPELDKVLDTLSGTGSSGGGTQSSQTSQLIVVTAPKASDQKATLTAFERDSASGSWKPVFGPTQAFLGEVGMGEPADNVYRTPQGTFALDQAFGRLANPGTKMPYFQVTQQDWWDSNMKSPTYNTHVHQAQSPGGDSENLYDAGPAYDYAVNIASNPQRIPGKASAIFLHASTGEPTMGCVAIDKDVLRNILTWLDPAKSPKIAIGVNQAAPTGNAPALTTPQSTTPQSTPQSGTPQSGTPQSGTPQSGTTSGLLDDNALTQLLNQLVGILPSMLGVGG
ncbi:L,D-transpeptidase family protein [Gordonia polyisoprenivorans]|uniref:L,D-transpeptidase family protein n=1 Tax=Gordonia polyisoprenivorans TaxID=84595 RepID=A0A846WIF1_9ACTN|nr:L,D-transpeptidase family protein [Gordonia polyisoprenivorans]NKY01298.1 L,D-transpeptidase family protein [Gordonia polyisoprenivorans]